MTLALTNTKGRIFNSHDIINFMFLKGKKNLVSLKLSNI